VEQDEFDMAGSVGLQAPEGRQYAPSNWPVQSVSLEHARQVSVLGPDDVQMGAVEEQLVLLVHCTQYPKRALGSSVSQTGVAPSQPIGWPSSLVAQGRQ
jgi:hypothetical protein